MKPLNLDNSPCSPISSNCVIWQGPAIPCIKLCTGDTVSDVVFQLATELCTIIDQLNVSNYDLSCFTSSACPPANFQALIQYLINQICASQGITVDTTKTTSTCPDCVVTVAPCFVQGTTTTMQLVDYVAMIGNKICSLVTELASLQGQINSLDIRVSVLENAPVPTFTLPSIAVSCLLTPGSYTIDVVLDALMNNTNGYCSLLNATGNPADISTAVLSQCIDDTDTALASLIGGGSAQTFQAYYAASWVINSDLNTAADAINNIWIAICDIYNAFSNLATPTSSVTAGNGITVTPTVVGLNTNYQVDYIEKPSFLVSLAPPANLNKTAPGLNTGRLCDGSIQVMTNVQHIIGFSLTDYDSTTGIFTIPTTGIYTLSFWTHYTRDAGTGWYDAAVPGMFTAGIMSPTGCNFYCVNNATPVVTMKHLDITGALTTRLTAGQQICLKVINLTNYNYTTFTGDIVQMSIQRVN